MYFQNTVFYDQMTQAFFFGGKFLVLIWMILSSMHLAVHLRETGSLTLFCPFFVLLFYPLPPCIYCDYSWISILLDVISNFRFLAQ